MSNELTIGDWIEGKTNSADGRVVITGARAMCMRIEFDTDDSLLDVQTDGDAVTSITVKTLCRFTFGWAIQRMRCGLKVRRRGWNGKGMFVVFQKGYPDGIPINKNTAEATGIPEGTVMKFQPYIMMKTADGTFVPWLASQTDMLSNDWELAG